VFDQKDGLIRCAYCSP